MPAALAGGVEVVVVVVVESACDAASVTASDIAAGASAHTHASRIPAFFKHTTSEGGSACRACFLARLGLAELARLLPARKLAGFRLTP